MRKPHIHFTLTVKNENKNLQPAHCPIDLPLEPKAPQDAFVPKLATNPPEPKCEFGLQTFGLQAMTAFTSSWLNENDDLQSKKMPSTMKSSSPN